MLRLRSCTLARILSSPPASPGSPLHRLLSAVVPSPAVSPNPSVAVEEYLVSTCGLTRLQALKASAKLSHLKSPAKPDAVLAFLAGLGLSAAAVAALVARDPKFLCAGVERTLAPNVVELTGLGLSRCKIARLISLSQEYFRRRAIISKLQYNLPLFGLSEHILVVFEHGPEIIGANLEKTVKPNVVLLQECGLDNCDITKLCLSASGMLLSTKPECLRAMVACAEGLGVPHGSGMFKYALRAVAFQSEEKITTKMGYLKKTFRWSDAEVGMAVSKAPFVLTRSKESLHSRSEFLFSEVGLEPAYIARRPTILTYSLEGRLRPRHYAIKFLNENGLLRFNPNYYSVFKATEEVFVEKYICPHKEATPHLAKDYADACWGQVPTRFKFT